MKLLKYYFIYVMSAQWVQCWHIMTGHKLFISQKVSAAALVRLQVVVEGVVLRVYQVHVPLAAHGSEDDWATCPVILKII